MRGFLKRLPPILGVLLVWVVILGWKAWAFGALWFDCPIATPGHPVAWADLLGVLILLTLWARGRRWAAGFFRRSKKQQGMESLFPYGYNPPLPLMYVD
jgi:hypothetical protein